MKKNYHTATRNLKTSKIVLLFLFLLSSVVARSQVKLMITGNIELDDGEKVAGAVISVEKNGAQYKKISISETGKFAVSITYQDEFIFSFEKKGYVTKKIAISTIVPKNILDEGYDPISFKVGLFKQYEGMNTVVFNQPVSRYKYDEKTDDFIFDTDYTKTIQSEITKVEAEVQVKKQEEKEIKKQQQLTNNSNQGGNKNNNTNTGEDGKQKMAISETDKNNRTSANALSESESDPTKKAKAKNDEEWKKKLTPNKYKDFNNLSEEEKAKRAKAKEEEERLKKENAEKNKNLYGAKGKEDEDKRKQQMNAKADEDARRIAEAKAKEEDLARLLKEAKAKSEEELRKLMADARMKSYLSKIYPEGITIETSKDKWKETTRVIVNRSGICNIFTEIKHSWGGKYYFKNNETISQHVFTKETKPIGNEAVYQKSE